MRIAFDVTPLESGHRLRGVGAYTRLLFDALHDFQGIHDFVFFHQGEEIPRDADLVHYPYFDPFFLTLPLIRSKPTVVTVHDLIPIGFPEHFPRGIRGEVKWLVQRQSLRGVDAVITDSLASKKDVVKFVGVHRDKVHVVYLAAAKIFRPIKEMETLASVRNKYSLPKQFVLYVGDVNWNKNIPGLIRAYSKLNQKQRERIALVLVGQAFIDKQLRETSEINTLIDHLGLTREVHKLGLVAEADLAAIYSLATVYVQPSFAEGFGLPVLEALSCACPVVSSNISSLAEIAGPAIKTNPYSTGDLTQKIGAALNMTQVKRQQLIDEGLKWVKNFTLEKTIKNTIKVYEKVLA